MQPSFPDGFKSETISKFTIQKTKSINDMSKPFDIATQQELKSLKRQIKSSREDLELLRQRFDKSRNEFESERIINRQLVRRAKKLLPRSKFKTWI